MDIILQPIGKTHTPYTDRGPFRPDEQAEGQFYLEIFPEYIDGLQGLELFSHLIVLYYFDKMDQTHLKAHPPIQPGTEVGVFASRSPKRVNKIGFNVVKIINIEDNRIYTSAMDALNDSPLLDIKPYISETDSRPDASKGWLK